jgi:hypothetical protein
MSKILSKLFSKRLTYLSLFGLFFVLALFAYQKTLGMSLFGDDWYIFWIIESHFGPGKQSSYFDPRGYTNPWGTQYLILLILSKIFGFWEQIYYFFSLLLRIFVGLAAFSFINYLIKDKLISTIASLFIVVGFAGIEATSSMLHMTTFIAAGFTMLSLKQIVVSQDNKSWKSFILGGIFFGIALASSPIRTHGLLLFFLLFIIIYWFFKENKFNKELIGKLILVILTATLIYKMGFFGNAGPGGNWGWVKIPQMIEMFQKGDYTFITAFLTNLGKVFVPDISHVSSSYFIKEFGNSWSLKILLYLFLGGVFILKYISRFTLKPKKNFWVSIVIYILLFSAIVIVQKNYNSPDRYFLDLLASWIGVLIATLLFWSIYIRFVVKEKSIAFLLFIIGPLIILTSLIVPLVFNPGVTLDSNHRYYALGLTGLGLVVASFLKFIRPSIVYPIVFGLVIVYLLFNILSGQKYLNQLYPTRNAEISNKTWDKMFSLLPKDFPNNQFFLFYMDDTENPGFAFNTVLFGFPPRMAIKYNIMKNQGIPAFTTSYEEIISAVTDGKAFKRLGYEEKPIKIDQIYAIKFTKDENLVDITEVTREKLNIIVNQNE